MKPPLYLTKYCEQREKSHSTTVVCQHDANIKKKYYREPLTYHSQPSKCGVMFELLRTTLSVTVFYFCCILEDDCHALSHTYSQIRLFRDVSSKIIFKMASAISHCFIFDIYVIRRQVKQRASAQPGNNLPE